MSNIKILSAVLSFLLLFAISCSNEGTTGGDAGNYNYFSVSEESGNSKDITIHNSKVSMVGTVGFTVNGSTSYTISIENVSGSTPCSLEASDFSYDKSTKKLTLSPEGLDKVNNTSDSEMEKAKPYEYTITFKVVDSSDTSKEKTIDVKVNLYNAKVIGKQEIRDMIKSMGTVSVSYIGRESKTVNFDFSASVIDFPFVESVIDFPNDYYCNVMKWSSGVNITSVSISISAVSDEIVKKLTGNEENYEKYFSGCNFNKEKQHVDKYRSKPNLFLYIKFTLKVGYALSSEVAHITSEGLGIQLILENEYQTWVE